MVPSMSMMMKALALPISVSFSRWSLLRIRKLYNGKQIGSLVGILVAVIWIFVASIEAKKDWFSKDQWIGYILLVFSAIFQAFEISFEERLFMIEPELTPLGLQQAVSTWKIILVLVFTGVCNLLPDSLGKTFGSNYESMSLAIFNLNE